MKNEIDLDLVKVKRELFEFVLSISKEEDSLSFTLQYAKELWDWMASGPLSDDIQDTVRAVDHCVGELYQQQEVLDGRLDALEQAGKAAGPSAPIADTAPLTERIEKLENLASDVLAAAARAPDIDEALVKRIAELERRAGESVSVADVESYLVERIKGFYAAPSDVPATEAEADPIPPVEDAEPPVLAPVVATAEEAKPQESVRSRLWAAIRDAGKDGMTYALAYDVLGLDRFDQTMLSNYVSEWKAEGKVVVRADNHLNRKRFWLKEFAPTEPEPPLPPTQNERILFYLRDEAKDHGASHPKIADETGVPEGSCQTVLSKMLNAGTVEHDDGIGKKRLWFAKGMKPRTVLPPLPSQSALRQCPCGNTFRPENTKQEACSACLTVETA